MVGAAGEGGVAGFPGPGPLLAWATAMDAGHTFLPGSAWHSSWGRHTGQRVLRPCSRDTDLETASWGGERQVTRTYRGASVTGWSLLIPLSR